MAKLKINNIEMEVPEGTTVLDAARNPASISRRSASIPS